MPVYDYSCECGYKTEMIDSMIGNKVIACPRCKEESLYRMIGTGVGFTVRSAYKDRSGERVYFKEPYFDMAMRRRFSSAKEKAEFMNKNGIVSNGDMDIKVKREKKEYNEMKMDTKKKKKGE